jgi:hypothetical protein
MARRRCKYGKLKHPRGRRICRLRSVRRKRYASRKSVSSERARELEYIARHKASLGRHRRRR